MRLPGRQNGGRGTSRETGRRPSPARLRLCRRSPPTATDAGGGQNPGGAEAATGRYNRGSAHAGDRRPRAGGASPRGIRPKPITATWARGGDLHMGRDALARPRPGPAGRRTPSWGFRCPRPNRPTAGGASLSARAALARLAPAASGPPTSSRAASAKPAHIALAMALARCCCHCAGWAVCRHPDMTTCARSASRPAGAPRRGRARAEDADPPAEDPPAAQRTGPALRGPRSLRDGAARGSRARPLHA